MSKPISSYSELYSQIKKSMQKSIEKVSIDVESLINDFLQKWYADYTPIFYIRTRRFLKSCTRTKTEIYGNKVIAKVYIDTNYQYSDVSAELVAVWANKGIHGDPETFGMPGQHDVRFWDDAMMMIEDYKMIQANFIEYLEQQGLSVVYKK